MPWPTTSTLLPRWLPAAPLPAWLVLARCEPHTNVLLCLCKQAKNTVVLLLGGPGSSERLGRKPGSGSLRGAGVTWRHRATGRFPPALHEWGLAGKGHTHQPQHGCPAALALLSQRCQASSDQRSWCASVRDVTCSAPGRLCFPSEEEFLSFLYNNCMCWVWWCRACRVLASPGTAPGQLG